MSSYKIEEFPEGLWRIDWLGKIQSNTEVSSEPEINVHLTQLKDDGSDPLANKSLTAKLKESFPRVSFDGVNHY